MFKITDIDLRTIGVHTSDDVYTEVRRITGSMYCAAAAKRWADTKDRLPQRAYSLLDFWDEQVSALKFGAVVIDDRHSRRKQVC